MTVATTFELLMRAFDSTMEDLMASAGQPVTEPLDIVGFNQPTQPAPEATARERVLAFVYIGTLVLMTMFSGLAV